MSKSEVLRTRTDEVMQQGGRRWQIEQAVCNLVLSQAICGSWHYLGVSKKDLRSRILSATQSRFEEAGGKSDVDHLSANIIQTQVRLDCLALLACFGIESNTADFAAHIRQLQERGLLDG
jgi:hypothetical protein